MATLQGNFAIDRTEVERRSQIRVAITNLTAGFAVPGGLGEAGLRAGRLIALLGTGADGQPGYALQGDATVVIDTPLVDMTGDVTVSGNTLGRAVVLSQTVAGKPLALSLDAPRREASVDFGQLDALITDLLEGAVSFVADQMASLKADISPQFERDANGNPLGTDNINRHPMAATLPLIGTSLTELIAADKILAIGEYTQRYLGSTRGEAGKLPEPNYGAAAQPSLRGLLAYLQTHWLPTIGAKAESLKMIVADGGVKISFDDRLSLSTSTDIAFGAEADALGLTVDGKITAKIGVDVDIAFDMSLNWSGGNAGASFDLKRLKVLAKAGVTDIDVTAALGPLSASLGDKSRQTGTLQLELGGEVRRSANGALGFVKTVDSLQVMLPVYAQLGSLDLAAGKTPTIRINGSPFSGSVKWSTENFDAIGDFSRLSVVDMILMFPDFIETLESIRQDERITSALPFLESSLDQVLMFGNAFKSSVYDKIDFYKPRVDLLSLPSVAVSRATDAQGAAITALVNPLGGFDAKFLEKKEVTLYRTVAGVRQSVGTFAIDKVVDSKTVALRGAQLTGVGLEAVIHEERTQITTLQEFITAVNRSGVLPAGMQIVFDPVHRTFGVPLRFREQFQPTEVPLNLNLGVDTFSLSTSAKAGMSVYVEGTLGFFADLDGRTIIGQKGSARAGSNLFSDSTFIFDSTMLGYTLELGGQKYTVVGVGTGGASVTLDREVVEGAAQVGYTLREDRFKMGIENVSLKAGIEAAISDLEVGLQMGFLSAKAGGAGTGSGVRLSASAGVSLDKNPGSGNPLDRRFTFDEISTSNIRFALEGTAQAKLRGLRVNPGIGADIPLAPNIEISMTALNLFNMGTTRVINQNPSYAADIASLVRAGTVGSRDLVIILPDLGSAFSFKDMSFADIVEATRMGLEFVRDSISSQPFYTVVLPVVGRSLADVFPFVDGFLAQVEKAAQNPAAAIADVERIFEGALGITDDNSLSADDQIFALTLNGEILNIHLKLEKVFEKKFGFSLDLQQLAAIAGPSALAGLDFVDALADVINPGAAGNITLAAMAKLQIQAGIRLNASAPEFFLYDYNPTRVQTVAVAAFGSVVFANRSSQLTQDNRDSILRDFRQVLTSLGSGVERISASVNSYWLTSSESGNRDAVHGDNQLAGRRQAAVMDLQNWLSTQLGVKVQLFAGAQAELASAGSQKLFSEVTAYRAVNVPPEQARGTYATVGIRVAGQDLYMGFEAGPVKLGVVGGWAAIDRDGLASTNDFATFSLRLDQVRGSRVDDGRFYLGSERIGDNYVTAVEGALGMNLPLSMSFSVGTIQLGSITAATTQAGLAGFLNGASGVVSSQKILNISVPNVQNIMDDFLSEFSLLGMLADPTRIIDGVDGALGVVQDTLGAEFTRDIPLVGSKLGDAGNFVRDVRLGLLQDLRKKLSAEGGAIGIVRSSLWDLFGTGGLNLILDSDDPGTDVSINDIQVGWYDRNGVKLGDWVVGQMPAGAEDAIQFNMKLGKKLVAANVDISLDFNLHGFSLDINGGFGFDLSWGFDFGFGLSVSSGFY
ncbi:MAG: hypothetical protein ACKODB_03250, partial [Betaproteobacteria bacterium]